MNSDSHLTSSGGYCVMQTTTSHDVHPGDYEREMERATVDVARFRKERECLRAVGYWDGPQCKLYQIKPTTT